jgi:hypothetical protein
MSFDKFRVLTWKNWTLQKRRPIAGAVQILVPIIIIVVFTWARNIFGNEFEVFRRTEAESFSLGNFTACQPSEENIPLTRIIFAPNEAVYQDLVEDAFNSKFVVEGYALGEFYQALYNSTEQSIAVAFTSDSPVI